MDECFGVAVVELGVAPSEFWGMSPGAFFAAFSERSRQRAGDRRSAEYRAGTIAATIANVNRGPKSSTVYRADHFFPALAESHEMTDEQIQAAFEAFAASHNQRVAAEA